MVKQTTSDISSQVIELSPAISELGDFDYLQGVHNLCICKEFQKTLRNGLGGRKDDNQLP